MKYGKPMHKCGCTGCKRMVHSNFTYAVYEGVLYFMCVSLSDEPQVYKNDKDPGDPNNLLVETHVLFQLAQLEDEMTPRTVPKQMQIIRFFKYGTEEPVYGTNPMCWFTDSSTTLTEITYTHASEPSITLVVEGQCSITDTSLLTCPCYKCSEYAINPAYMMVTPAPDEQEEEMILEYANVCVDPPESRSDHQPDTRTPTREIRPPPSTDDVDIYIQELLTSLDLSNLSTNPTPEIAAEMGRPTLPDIHNATVSTIPLGPILPREPRRDMDTDSETSSVYSDDSIFDDMPVLMCQMPMLIDGVRFDLWIDTDLENTDEFLFGGAIDITTRQYRRAYAVIDPYREWGYLDDALVDRHPSGPRFRRTTRASIDEQPDYVSLPVNGLRYSAVLLTVRNLDRPSVTWLRDDKRDNVIWTAGHHCLLSGLDIPCGCGICRSLQEHKGLSIGFLNGFYFVRITRLSYPFGHVVTETQDDLRRRIVYNLVEENIQQRRNSEQRFNVPTIHHANVTHTPTAPTTKAISDNNPTITPTKTPTPTSSQRKRSNSEPTTPAINTTPTRPSTPPASKYAIYELNNKHNPLLAQCFHLRGRTAKRKWKLKMRLIISDGGASKSMFADRSLFTNYRETTNSFVKMADGTMCRVLGIGDVGKLKDVLHVENLVFDLVSESWCDLMGMTGTWKKGIRTVYDTDGSIFYSAYLEDGLYVVNPALLGIEHPKYTDDIDLCLASKAQVVNELHETFGHIDKDRIQRGIASGHIPWLHDAKPSNLKKCSDKCIVCQLAKSQRRSFTQPLRPVLTRGQHTYLDLYGPVDTPSLIYGNTYVAGFIDAYSAHL